MASSVFTIMALSLDRFLAIRHPMTYRSFSSGKCAARIIASIWVISLLVMVPLILVRRVDTHFVLQETLYFCKETWSSKRVQQIYVTFLFAFMFVIPGCFVTASYSRIGCQLWTEGKTLYRGESHRSRKQAEKVMSGRKRVARMLVIVAILFAVCWMPYHMLSLYLDFQPGDLQPNQELVRDLARDVLPFTMLLGHSNSAFNPILYCFMNKSFRRNTTRLLHIQTHNKRPGESPVNAAYR